MSHIHLAFHGAVILLIGLLSGIPFAFALVHNRQETQINAWRVAHSALSMGGIMMIVIAVALPMIQLGDIGYSLLVASLIVAGYTLIALPVAAWTGYRGIIYEGPLLNRLLYIVNLLGVPCFLISVICFIVGAYNAL